MKKFKVTAQFSVDLPNDVDVLLVHRELIDPLRDIDAKFITQGESKCKTLSLDILQVQRENVCAYTDFNEDPSAHKVYYTRSINLE